MGLLPSGCARDKPGRERGDSWMMASIEATVARAKRGGASIMAGEYSVCGAEYGRVFFNVGDEGGEFKVKV